MATTQCGFSWSTFFLAGSSKKITADFLRGLLLFVIINYTVIWSLAQRRYICDVHSVSMVSCTTNNMTEISVGNITYFGQPIHARFLASAGQFSCHYRHYHDVLISTRVHQLNWSYFDLYTYFYSLAFLECFKVVSLCISLITASIVINLALAVYKLFLRLRIQVRRKIAPRAMPFIRSCTYFHLSVLPRVGVSSV